jgi:hypothetical protein
MLDAFVGTIDYEGETLDEALVEIRRFFEVGPDVDSSVVIERAGRRVQERHGWFQRYQFLLRFVIV